MAHTEDKVETDEFAHISYSKITAQVVRTITHTTWRYWLAMGVAGAIVLYGIGVYYYQTVMGMGVWGTNQPVFWGIDIASFIFWIGLSHSGTLLSAILLLTRSDWRRPIFRSAEAMTLFSVMVALVVITTHLGRPWRAWYGAPYPNFRQLWSNFNSALGWDMLAIASYMTMSALFLYVGTIPDFAAVRDNVTGWRKKLYSYLAMGWTGSDREWRHLQRAYLLVACLVVPLAASVHSVVSWDWSVTMNPGLHSTIFAPYFVVGAIYSGIAGVVLIMILLRKFMHFDDYIKTIHFENLAKVLVVMCFVWLYINVVEILIPWYHAENFELFTLAAKMQGVYAPLYWTMIFTCGLVPVFMLNKKVRTNVPMLFAISIGIEIGMYLERYLIIVPALDVGFIPAAWGSYSPTWVEYSLLLWTFAVFSVLFLAWVKIFPSLSVFEVKELLKVPMRGGKYAGSKLKRATRKKETVKEAEGVPALEGETPLTDGGVAEKRVRKRK